MGRGAATRGFLVLAALYLYSNSMSVACHTLTGLHVRPIPVHYRVH